MNQIREVPKLVGIRSFGFAAKLWYALKWSGSGLRRSDLLDGSSMTLCYNMSCDIWWFLDDASEEFPISCFPEEPYNPWRSWEYSLSWVDWGKSSCFDRWWTFKDGMIMIFCFRPTSRIVVIAFHSSMGEVFRDGNVTRKDFSHKVTLLVGCFHLPDMCL